jgi:hypothetical protein
MRNRNDVEIGDGAGTGLRARRESDRPCASRVSFMASWVVALASTSLPVLGAEAGGLLPPAPFQAASAPAKAASAAAGDAPIERSLALPAFEIIGFDFLLNRYNRFFGEGRDDYKVSLSSIRRNLRSGWGTDRDPFATNQLGHPYQGSIYHGFARSAGFSYWESAGYAFLGSVGWEIAGEQTHPSRNDQVASGIGGTFLGEALFRMSNLVLEHGGGLSPFWREVASAAIAPSAGFNRLAYGDRFGGIFSSRGAAYFSQLQFGYSRAVKREENTATTRFRPNEALLDFSIDYGLPGADGYRYTRPFDYFNFRATASTANGIENVMTRGLLVGEPYELGSSYRGVWGLYGSYDYIAPQTYRVSSTALSLGSTAQWWLSDSLSLQGTAMAGLGYAAVGTTHGTASDRDYNYGVAPQALLALRVTDGDKTAYDFTAREYFVSRVASGTGGGHDNIVRADLAWTRRLSKQQAISIRLLANRRDATFLTTGTHRQTQASLGIFYTLLGQDRFGTVDWR